MLHSHRNRVHPYAIQTRRFTGIIVNFYNEILELRRKETLSAFLDRLEQLPNLSHEELVELSARVQKFRIQKK